MSADHGRRVSARHEARQSRPEAPGRGACRGQAQVAVAARRVRVEQAGAMQQRRRQENADLAAQAAAAFCVDRERRRRNVRPANQGERGELGKHPRRGEVAAAQHAAAAVAMFLGAANDAVDRGPAEEEAEARRRRRLGDAKRQPLDDRRVPATVARPGQRLRQGCQGVGARHQVGGGEVGATAGQDQQLGKPVPGRKPGEPVDDRVHRAIPGEHRDMTLASGQDGIERARHGDAVFDPNRPRRPSLRQARSPGRRGRGKRESCAD